MEKFTRQYILVKGKLASSPFVNWKTQKFGEYVLYYHQDLPFHFHERDGFSIGMIGLAFHIEDLKIGEKEFVREAPKGEKELLDYVDLVSGNFALFVQRGEQLQLFNDSAAAMKLFYFKENNEIKGVASDPKLLQDVFGLEKTKDPEALKFYESETFKHHRIWVGDLTYYDQVFQVLPNHLLNINTASTERFFPRKPLEKISVDESIDKVRKHFDVIVSAASKRYNLKCALTGGWDSRMVLASLKNVRSEIECFTFRRAGRSLKDPDFTIPQSMANKLGLAYRIIDFQDKFPVDENLKASYEHYGPRRFNHIQQGYAGFSIKEDLALLGTVSEICKNYYDDIPITNGKNFAQAAHYPVVPYVVSYFQKKLDELKEFEKFGYDIRDLGHWEQDITNFAAQDALHSLSHVFTFPMFNNRIILTSILAQPREMREKQEHQYYHQYLEKVWPELNQFEINATLKKKMIVWAKRLGFYGVYKVISTRLRK